MKLSEYFRYNGKTDNASELENKKVLRTVFKGVRIPWFVIILGAFLAVFNAIVILTQFDNYNAIFNGSLTSLKPLWAYLLASFIQYLIIFASVIYDRGLVTVVTRVRRKLWAKMMHLPLKEFEEESPDGMLSRLTSDAEYAARPFTAVMTVLQLLTYFMSVSSGAPKDVPQATIYLVITLVLALITLIFTIKVSSKSVTLVQNRISAQTAHYSEHLDGIKFIKASSAEEKAIERSNELIDERYNAALYNAFSSGLQALSSNFTYIIIYSCAFLGGIAAIKAGSISTTAPINGIYMFGMQLELAMVALLTLPNYFSAAGGGTKKIASIFRMQEEDTESGRELETTGDIRLESVSFGYGDKDTVRNISVCIPEGKITAVIGPNGSGKSTLIKLIDRLYVARNGKIYLGNESSADVSLKSWRSRFAVVSQDASLFSGTIRENILYGANREVSEEEMMNAVKAANLTDVVQLHPDGLDRDIGIKGDKLSGGEQQRVAIARALLKDPEILILDEATANLDQKTEEEVKQGLKALMEGRTVIMVAHSYSAIRDADLIIVMKDGEIEAAGTKEELAGTNDFFAQMVLEG